MSESAPAPAPAQSADPSALAYALQVTQQSLSAFQKMQEQTASLHRQFLENQEAAQRTLQLLVEQQQAVLQAGLGMPFAAPALLPAPPPRPALPPVLPPAPPVPVPAAPVPYTNGSTQARPTPAAPPPPPAPVRPAAVPTPEPVRKQPPLPAPAPTNGTMPHGPNAETIRSVLLAVVSEKTGYPSEMLDLGMALDADLGIDSIKRVEILSALQERLPEAPAVKPEHLGSLHTLRHVADFLAGGAANASASHPEGRAPSESTPAWTSGLDAALVQSVLLAVVSEKTGYPSEMLDLGMALDADLGIDSIKRVEILSALQERLPEAPAVKPEHLGTLHTLRHVADFLTGGAGPLASGGREPPVSAAGQRPEEDTGGSRPPLTRSVERSVLRALLLDTSRPRPRVELPPGSEVWLVGEGIELAGQLEQRGLRPRVLSWDTSPSSLPADSVAGLVLMAPETLTADFPLQAFRWLRHTASALRRAGQRGGAVLATVSRLDGSFGLSRLEAGRDSVAGALAGLAKTARHEWPEVSCKAIDLDPAFGNAAGVLVEELLRNGPAEVGVSEPGRSTLELVAAPASPAGTALPLSPSDVVVITGGARGVTAEAAVALAEAFRPTLVLVGRTPLPGPEPEWLAHLSDEAEIKRAIGTRLNGDATPRAVGEQFARVAAEREVRNTLARLEAAGSRVVYHAADVRDPAAVAALLAEVRSRFGPITGLVHGAGVLADRRIEDLSDEQFEGVYATKVRGLFNLLDATRNDPLKVEVLFSSSTGRFGRTGQAAYAAANEVLNKVAQQQSRLRPDCRVVAINWGPWEGGMVTPALRKIFAAEGVGLIPLAEGGRFLVEELSAADRAAEVVALVKGTTAASEEASAPPTAAAPRTDLGVAFERKVDLEGHPVLRSHVIDGRAVLPMALHLEWLAHAALHGNPGLHFHGIDDLRVLQGVFVDEGSPAQVRTCAGKAAKRDGFFVVPVELRGGRGGREVVHSRAEVVLASQLPPGERVLSAPSLEPYPHSIEAAYADLLFHGPDLHVLTRVVGVSESAIVADARTAPAPGSWLAQPLRGNWLADPAVLDASFQLLILWSRERHGAGSLPCFAGRYRQFRRTFPAGVVRVVARVTRDSGTLARADIDYLDGDGRLIARMQDYECVIDPALNETFRRNRSVRA